MNPVLNSLLTEIKCGLHGLYSQRLKGVYVFGSYARETEDSESDLDILVVLHGFDRTAVEIDRTGSLIAGLSLKYGISVSTVFLKEQEWLYGKTPFLSNVRDEAIPV